ncbi:gastrula zinc finger protein XlCGF17.1-like [Amyelois transitella]|uniref:gastrula zinc finger protein XlCGF17.1-like n=1 Tax=Amyelois transitella TaxID=680683 RepID=UPI0029906229|nr:gastrula zinc finger protein XlCGF17.1-like [Amyelois transitella]
MASAYFKVKMLRKKKKKIAESKKQTTATAENTCRICLKEGKIPIYTDNGPSDVSEAIRTFGDIQISENDEFPKYLCEQCQSLLQGAISFRKSAKNADSVLRQGFLDPPDLRAESEVSDISNENILNDDNILKKYNCKLCKLEFETRNELTIHKSSKQHKRVRIQCQICYRLFTATLFNRHLLRHQTATHLVCDVCGKLYRKDNLVRHLQLHSYELPFKCQVCPYRGRFLESLKIHRRTHTGDKPFSCDKCDLRFLTRSNLNRHLLTHKKEKPHKCVECGRSFYTKRDLDVHFKADHAGIKDFGCKMCRNKYGTKKALMRHELTVHKRNKMAKGRMPLYLQAEYKNSNDDLYYNKIT